MIGDEQSQPPVGLFLCSLRSRSFYVAPDALVRGVAGTRPDGFYEISCAAWADESLPYTEGHDAEFHHNSFRTRWRGLRSDPDVCRGPGRGGSPSGFERGVHKETRRCQHGIHSFQEKAHDPPAQIKRYIGQHSAGECKALLA